MDRKHPYGWIVPRDWMVDELDEGETAVSVFSVVKRVDQDGSSAWSVRIAGDDLSDEERYGAIAAVVHGLRLELQGDWSGGGPMPEPDETDETDETEVAEDATGESDDSLADPTDDAEGEDPDDAEPGFTAFANLFPIAWVTESLPEGQEAVALFAIIKTRDLDGTSSWATRMAGAEISSEELYGTLAPLAATLLDELAAGWA